MFLFLCAMAVTVFGLVYRLTGVFFEKEMVPYPFERFGILAGLAAVLVVFGCIFLLKGIIAKT